MIKAKIIPVLICMTVLAGCASAQDSEGKDKINVICTVFPEYDWTREIIGESEGVGVTLLADNGTDFHSYQPSTEDIVAISGCDILVYIGGESDKWVDDALKNAVNPDMKVIKLTEIAESELLGEPETLEEEHEEHEEEEHGFDEHIWLSLKNASLFCGAIAEALSSADTENADTYRKNAEEYISKLDKLDSDFEEKVQTAKRKTVLFGDRFPFVYMMEDYDISYYAAFPGCSSETDAGFDTVVNLAKEMDRDSLPAVLTIEGSDCNIAEAIISNTKEKNQKILALDSMQTVSKKDIEGGKTYLSVMEKNIEVLTEALN